MAGLAATAASAYTAQYAAMNAKFTGYQRLYKLDDPLEFVSILKKLEALATGLRKMGYERG